jgi:FkbM family methyltransferase
MTDDNTGISGHSVARRLRSLLLGKTKKFLASRGYELRAREAMAYGIDRWLDVTRLSATARMPIGVIFDVGANEGQTAKELLTAFPNAKIYSFEPAAETFEILNRKVAGVANISTRNLALGSAPGKAEMYVYESSLINSLVPNAHYSTLHKLSGRRTACDVDTIDRFCAENRIDHIDLLKIDTEGFELEVLRGAEGLLGDGKVNFIIAEFNRVLPTEAYGGGALAPLAEFLKPFRFAFIATFTDYVSADREMFVVSNVLFARLFDAGER